MSRAEYSRENGILMYIPHQAKLLIIKAVTWERQDKKSMFINLYELETNENMNTYFGYLYCLNLFKENLDALLM